VEDGTALLQHACLRPAPASLAVDPCCIQISITLRGLQFNADQIKAVGFGVEYTNGQWLEDADFNSTTPLTPVTIERILQAQTLNFR
jgi:hypothetical protein